MRGQYIIGAVAAVLCVANPLAANDRAGELWASGKWAEAVALWVPQADAGDANAQFNLAQAYRLGRGVPQSLERAGEYYRSAAAAGHKPAAEQLGLIYYDKPETRRAAIALLRALAAEGRPRAAYVIGLEHLSGQVLEYDVERARYFLEIAAKGGVPMAVAALQGIPAPAQASSSVAGQQREVAADAKPAAAASEPAGDVASWNPSSFGAVTQQELPVSTKTAASASSSLATSIGPVDSKTGPVQAERWSVWFGPYRDEVTAAVKFRRIAARAGLREPSSIQTSESGAVVHYGLLDQSSAEALCADLSKRKFFCRGTIEAPFRGVSGAGTVVAAPEVED